MLCRRPRLAFVCVLLLVADRSDNSDLTGSVIPTASLRSGSRGAHASSNAAGSAGGKFGPSLYQCLNKAGLTSFKKLVDAAGLKDYFSTSYQVNTLFAATNAGVAQLYAALQLSEAQVLRDRQLARQLLQYNTLPYVRRTKYWPTFGNSQKKQKTLVPGLMLRLSTTRGGRLAVGGFANQASLLPKPNSVDLVCGQSVMHITNAVLIPIVVSP